MCGVEVWGLVLGFTHSSSGRSKEHRSLEQSSGKRKQCVVRQKRVWYVCYVKASQVREVV